MIDTPQQDSDSKYRAIFEGAPVAMWDEDFSGVKLLIDRFVASGITNIGQHLRSHPEAVIDCVKQVRVRHVNRVARQFYGAETEEKLIAALPSLFDEAAFEVFREEVTAFAEGANSFQAELYVSTLTAERRRVMMNVSLLGTTRSDWSEVVVTFTDITERRRLEQSLKNANESLRRLNQHLEQFAYAAAHDMREPLRTISLYAQLLQRHQPPEPGTRAEAALQYILESGRRMDTLMEDLLAFARIGAPDTLDPDTEETDPHVVMAEVLSSLSATVQLSTADIHIDSDLPVTHMHAVHLRQLFQNLVSNAIKYCATNVKPVVHVSGALSNGEIRFCVADNGIGIGSEYHEKIFGIFKRLHGQEIEGNGIGLALCKKIVEDYRGRIWVESAPGQGSSFYFAIPIKNDPG